MTIGRRKLIDGDFEIRTYLFLFLLVVILVLLSFNYHEFLVWLIVEWGYNGFISWAYQYHDVLNGVMSTILTLALVLLYWQQKSILGLNHKPNLVVENFSAKNTLREGSNEFECVISNLGNGSAKNIRLFLEAEFLSDENIRIDNSVIPLIEKESGSYNSSDRGSYIQAQQTEKILHVEELWLTWGAWSGESSEGYVIGSEVNPQRTEADILRLKMSLHYRTPTGNDEKMTFFDRVIPFRKSLNNSIEYSMEWDAYNSGFSNVSDNELFDLE